MSLQDVYMFDQMAGLQKYEDELIGMLIPQSKHNKTGYDKVRNNVTFPTMMLV